MDLFEIDMEFLRRVDALRGIVKGLGGDSAQPVLDGIDAARERAGLNGIDEALLRLLKKCWVEAEADDIGSGSRLAMTTLSALECLEQFCVADDPTAADTLVHSAAATVLGALGRPQADWQEVRYAPADPEAGPVGTARVAETPEPCPDAPDLDELAATVMLTSAEDRGELAGLLEQVDELGAHPWVPADAAPRVATIHERLTYACSGSRRSKKKTEAARSAMDDLGVLLGELMIQLQEQNARRSAYETVAAEEKANADLVVPNVAGADDPVAEEGSAGEEISEAEAEAIFAAAAGAPSAEPRLELIDGDLADDHRELVDRMEAEAEAEIAARTSSKAKSQIVGVTEFTLSDNTDPDLLDDFLAEGFDYLEQAEAALLALENDPTDAEAINVVFRAFHTIKGVAGFLELEPISKLSHHAESLLSTVREGEIVFSPAVADLTLKSADVLRELLVATRGTKEQETNSFRIPAGFEPVLAVLADADSLECLAQGITVEIDVPSEGEGAEAQEGGTASANEGSVRVKTSRLDRLLDLVGELVVAHAMVAEDPTILDDHQSDLARKVSRSEKILRELQDHTTSMRMIPLKPAFRKLSRVVRDVSRRAGKPVQLITDGEDTELDRNMVNIITDPLVHMVRNSIDHGVEPPEERIEAGKPELGEVRLSANQSGGSVVIEISDDGRGLSREKIASKAIDKDIIENDRGMSDEEVFNLIFAPGFSTAEKVTDISGRGVGMDVVRKSVESLRGRIDIRSKPGEGSCFSIHLPLTLAITDGMLIRVGPERYIIPTTKIHMSFRPEEHAISRVSGRGEMVMLHGELVPLIRLHDAYEIRDSEKDPAKGLLVIVGEGARRSALLVDELLGQQQFVVKALSGDVADVPGIAGGTIMGDGSVGLILDPEEIITLWRKGTPSTSRGAA